MGIKRVITGGPHKAVAETHLNKRKLPHRTDDYDIYNQGECYLEEPKTKHRPI